MKYGFVCPKCDFRKEIDMKMSEYTSSGHLCDKCNEEMIRDISAMGFGMLKDNTGSFYKTTTF